eukprot:13883626-Heterocapsa_arctica.AAC.1
MNPWDLYTGGKGNTGSGGYAAGPSYPSKGTLKGSPNSYMQKPPKPFYELTSTPNQEGVSRQQEWLRKADQ